MIGMKNIGEKFSQGKAFIPDLLISSKAMNAAMVHLKPYFDSGEAKLKGTLVIGTVPGDLHDIGKNIVKMVMEGNGWKVVDLGTDTSESKFIAAVEENPDCIVGLSALLTTTMMNMEKIVKAIKEFKPEVKVFVGGAPLSDKYARSIKADGYFPDPQSLVNYLSEKK
jgi:5-methyltetrahydrofolate--homocysteine methyltransferase